MTLPFKQRIAAMNAMYKLPAAASPTLPTDVADRLVKFKAILIEEIHEIDDRNGKFLKGPNYWQPEPRIKALLEARGIHVAR